MVHVKLRICAFISYERAQDLAIGIRGIVLDDEKPEVQHALVRKLREMKAYYDGEEGKKFIWAVARSVGVPMEKIMHFPKNIVATCHLAGDPDECFVEAFHATLTGRINTSLANSEAFIKKSGGHP